MERLQNMTPVCRTIIVTNHCPPAMRKRDVWRVDQFHLLRKVGSGYASTVYLGTCRTTGNQIALKLYHKNKLSELNHFQVAREITIHSTLDHKHIIQLWAAFEDNYGIYLVFEYAAKGDVFTEVERRGGQLSEAETVRQVIHPFLSALDYLHSNYIIHRDIKPENLLFTSTGILKVGDFGLSINFSQERPVTRVGTLDYMAPEVVVCPDKHKPQDHKEQKHLYYTPLVDAWAVGVLAYELIVGRPPFDKGQKKATIAEILNGEPFLPPWLSEGAMHFIRWALTKEQGKRPSVQQLAEHPWIVSHMKPRPAAPGEGIRRAIGRTDSFVELRQLGFRGSNAPVGDTSPTGSKVPTVLSVMQGGRTLGHSNSMSAMDGMRFRDIKLDSVPGAMAAAAESALAAVKRVSDGDGTTGGRPSAAGGRVSRAGTARNSGTGGLSRMNSMNAINAAAVALAAAAAVGGTNETESPKAGGKGLMTREELLASLTAPFPSPRSGSGSPSLMRSFTAGHGRSSPMVQPTASQLGMRISGGGNVTSAGTSGSPALARGQSPGRSPLHRSAPFEPGTMNPAAGGGNGGSSSTSDALAHDLAHVRIGDSSAPHSPSRLGVSSSTTSGASCLRPQPPQMPSPSSRGLKNGSPLIPSRLSQSFTSPMSPLAGLGGSAGAAQTQPGVSPQPPATISRLGQSATTPSAATPAGSSRAGSVQTPLEVPPYGGFGGGMGDSSGAASPRVQQQAASPSAGPGAESGAGTPRSVQGQSSGHNSPRGAGVEQECDSGSDRDSVGNSHGKRKSPGASAKGLFGSIRKVFS